MDLSFADLGMAYRKAKVDLYYAMNPPLQKLVDYEADLEGNLARLWLRLSGTDDTWLSSTELLGSWTYVPKSIPMKQNDGPDDSLIFSSPSREWSHVTDDVNAEDLPRSEFRLMSRCSIDFHVFSALWIMKIGHKYDSLLSSSAYGSRLRRTSNDGDPNPLSVGSFVPYFKPFGRWRDQGIAAMRNALAEKKRVVALTADVTAFYHELDPVFMLDPIFADVVGVELDVDEQRLHARFIEAMRSWGALTPKGKGLPVGVSASAVIANVALLELDRFFENEVVPLYYGRYVDDIMVVMENGSDFSSAGAVWKWLIERSSGRLLKATRGTKKAGDIGYETPYLKGSRVRFSNGKNKVFLLEGPTGRSLVDSLSRAINERASEWRSLPNLPEHASDVATDIVAATQSDGSVADNLRKADSLTMRRAGFAIKLRDFEAYERDLEPNAWAAHRHAFLDAFIQHVLVLPHFFDLANYLPRVIRLATGCSDFSHLSKILWSLEELQTQVLRTSVPAVSMLDRESRALSEDIHSRWIEQLGTAVYEAISSSFPANQKNNAKRGWQSLRILSKHISFLADRDLSPGALRERYRRLFEADLAQTPFRFSLLPSEIVSQRGIPSAATIVRHEASVDHLVDRAVTHGYQIVAAWAKLESIPRGLMFSTRPLGLQELMIVCRSPLKGRNPRRVAEALLATRGYSVKSRMPTLDGSGVLTVPSSVSDDDASVKSIALASWATSNSSWVAAASRRTDPDTTRYHRLNSLVNAVLSEPRGIDYLIFPELSIPPRWYLRLSQKLGARGISLIAGVEYLHRRGARVQNQVWASLTFDGLGFPTRILYRQDKQKPALHEESELFNVAGVKLSAKSIWKVPPVIDHGGFKFALLVCSELTNIAYRSSLRGRIDALFVPEWNKDISSFDSIVESSALDIHAYIIQSNDRRFGSSRVRAPYKDSWLRDIVRVTGGTRDYFVVGDIRVNDLRRFQSSHRSPASPYKPTPDGFAIDRSRRMLPLKK